MSEKAYRGFNEDGSKYHLDDNWYDVTTPNGKQLVDWKNRMKELVSDNSLFSTIQDKSEELSKEILTSTLKDFDYDKMLESYHPKELEGAAGEVYGFLYAFGTPRERQLLMKQYSATQK